MKRTCFRTTGLAGLCLIALLAAACGAEKPKVRINPKDGAEMVWISPGEFLMGSRQEEINTLSENDPDRKSMFSCELPQRRVYLDGYWIYKNLVTVAQYRQFCHAIGREMPPAPRWGWKHDHPIVIVTWYDATAYCKWAGVRLPTEAEWEKAARGADGRSYPWGSDWDGSKCANSVIGHHQWSTQPVGSYPTGSSPYGVLDMAGNVEQWCSDWYGNNYYRNSPSRNPRGPDSGDFRVLRGGSWGDVSWDFFRCSFRSGGEPDVTQYNWGFRCAQSP